jgi:hypothetical protein
MRANLFPHCPQIFCTTVLPESAFIDRAPVEVVHDPAKKKLFNPGSVSFWYSPSIPASALS